MTCRSRRPAACPSLVEPSRRERGDSGAIAVLVALLLPVVFIFVAFAVDVARWYVELQRLQRAADAGALAGAPFMPANLNSTSSPPYAAALREVERNGYPASDTVVTKVVVPNTNPVAYHPTKVRVTVTTRVSNGIAAVFGFPTTTLHRTGVADFAGPVAMGSPCNLFGREDMEAAGAQLGSVDCATAGKYWVNIAGRYTNKARGDGFSSSWCTKPDTSIAVAGQPYLIDNCSGTDSSGANPGRNLDWGPSLTGAPSFPGYVFKVRAKASGPLTLEGYDIGWAVTGDNCTEGHLVGTTAGNSFVPAADATARYARSRQDASGNWIDNPFCPGDSQMPLPEGNDSSVQTVVTVRAPSTNPYTPLDGAVICTMVLDGYDRSTAATALSATGTGNVLARTFHRWSNLMANAGNGRTTGSCGTGGLQPTISVTAGQDYSIQVQTVGGGGQNRFALRASLGGAGVNRNVSIFAVDQVSLYNNVPSGQSMFNFVRLDSSAAGHTLQVRFYDIGDSNASVTAAVLQPDLLTPFSNCTGTGPVSGALTGCAVTATSSVNGGRWQTISIPIDQGYRCPDDEDQAQCWVRIRLNTTAYQADTTTWAAELLGDPVRLVE